MPKKNKSNLQRLLMRDKLKIRNFLRAQRDKGQTILLLKKNRKVNAI